MNFKRTALRARLGLGIAVILAILLVAGIINLQLARESRSLSVQLEQNHRRIAAYLTLNAAAWDLQARASGLSRTRVATSEARHRESLRRFEAELGESVALAGGPGNPEAVKLRRLGEAVGQMFKDSSLISRYETLIREESSPAQREAMMRLWRPFRLLSDTLGNNIRVENAVIDNRVNRVQQLSARAFFANLAVLGLSIVTGALMLMLIFRRLAPALGSLAKGAAEFAAGNLDYRINLSGKDELADLSSTMDQMAGQIAEQQRALRHASDDLALQVHERTAELETIAEKLARRDEERRRFLADVGHELRTPLTIIRGEAQLTLRDQPEHDDGAGAALTRILEQTDSLSRLVDDIFLIARAESGGLALVPQVVDLNSLAANVVQMFQRVFEDAVIGFTPETFPAEAFCDPDRVRQALVAVLDNACRHTRPEVHIDVELACNPDTVSISVSDDGPGLPAALIAEGFGRFRRGRDSTGTGLGLALIQALTEAQGGTVVVENRPRRGARVFLSFPRKQRARASAPPAERTREWA